MATKEQIIALAQRDADREGKPMAVLNLNRFNPLYVVRYYDPRFETDLKDSQFVYKVEPQPV